MAHHNLVQVCTYYMGPFKIWATLGLSDRKPKPSPALLTKWAVLGLTPRDCVKIGPDLSVGLNMPQRGPT